MAAGPPLRCTVWPVKTTVVEVPFDVAASMSQPRSPLLLATHAPPQGADIAVVGHPARNDEENDLLSNIFANVFDVKRLMPGKYAGQQAELSFGRTVRAGLDDATSLSSDLGATVVDIESGQKR